MFCNHEYNKNNKNMNQTQKGFSKYFIIILVVLVIGGIGFYLWQQTRLAIIDNQIKEEDLTVDETANWKTYRSEDYNFEIKYPPEASMEIDPRFEGDVFNMLFPNEGAPISIYVYQNPQEYTLNSKELNQWIEKNDLSQKVLGETESIKIDNTDAIKYFANESGSPSPHTVLTSKGKFIYKIDAYIYEGSRINDIIFNQILSTFKFVD
jgi:hypothetical protein